MVLGPWRLQKKEIVFHGPRKATLRVFFCLVLALWSSNPASDSLTGFVKSQEGENEEGSEGELVVRFGETLPKVMQEEKVSWGRDHSNGGQCAPEAGLLRL